MTDDELKAYRQRNEARRARKNAAVPGPWAESFPGHAVLVYQAGGTRVAMLHSNEPSLLYQESVSNALFIARAKNDPVEADVDALIEAVVDMRRVASVARDCAGMAIHDIETYLASVGATVAGAKELVAKIGRCFAEPITA